MQDTTGTNQGGHDLTLANLRRHIKEEYNETWLMNLAERMGISYDALTAKLDGDAPMYREDLTDICSFMFKSPRYFLMGEALCDYEKMPEPEKSELETEIIEIQDEMDAITAALGNITDSLQTRSILLNRCFEVDCTNVELSTIINGTSIGDKYDSNAILACIDKIEEIGARIGRIRRVGQGKPAKLHAL